MDFPKIFVCATREKCEYYKHVNAPAFRRSFVLAKKPDRAEILICGLGFYDLFVNGEKVTKGLLAPYISNPDDYTIFDKYDLTDKLNEGENVIGVVLGNGMQNPMTETWQFNEAKYAASPKLALAFEAKCGDDTVTFDAASMKWAPSPITFVNHRLGVHYDARLETDGWCEAGFDDSDWQAPLLAEIPRGEAKLCDTDPIVVKREIPALSVKEGGLAPYENNKKNSVPAPETDFDRDGGYIYDFGVNTAGIFRLVLRNTTPGQKISVQVSEKLDGEGRVDYSNISFYPDGYSQRDIYICRGADEEIFEPMFVYHGYRYLHISGLTEEQATLDAVTMLQAYSDIDTRAKFSCSDETANTLYKMALNSDVSNLHYFPTDCPHREKNGWTGDAAASAEHMVLTLTVERTWREWLRHILKAQDTLGRLPGIVPTAGWGFTWGNGPAWDRVLFNLPYFDYLYTGSTVSIRECGQAMLRYLNYASGMRDADGLIRLGLGDWSPFGTTNCHAHKADLKFTDTAMVYEMCREAKVMFEAVGRKHEALYVASLGEEILSDIRKHLIDFGRMRTTDNCVASQALAIYHGIFNDSEKKAAGQELLKLLDGGNGLIGMGYLGARVLFHVLTSIGEEELAYELITRREFPSYGYLIDCGLTSLPEKFVTKVADMASLNHHFFGDINHWFIRTVLGINVNPDENDPNRIIVKPHFIKGLDHTEGEYDAPAGKVTVKWTRIDETSVDLDVQFPEGVRGSIILPEGYTYEEGKGSFRPYEKNALRNFADMSVREIVKTDSKYTYISKG